MATQAQLHDVELHALIGRMIDEGRLPLLLADNITSGYGSGSKCHGCSQPVTHTQIEYDVGDFSEGTARLSLHLECYVLWQVECIRRLHKREPGPRLN